MEKEQRDDFSTIPLLSNVIQGTAYQEEDDWIPDEMKTPQRKEGWLWGWDETPGIVSIWANNNGQVTLWRRNPETEELLREEARFRPWLLLDRLDDLQHLGNQLGHEGEQGKLVTFRELDPPGELRFWVSSANANTLTSAVLYGASRRLGHPLRHVRELGQQAVLAISPNEQYLVSTGRTYFRDLAFDQLRRMQFDLETTGLSPERNRIFLIAIRDPSGVTETLEANGEGDAAEADLIRRLIDKIRTVDPDVIENHNLHGFDLPFLQRRASLLGVPLSLGRTGLPGLLQRPAQYGTVSSTHADRRIRFVAPGRELIDTLDAVRRYALATPDLTEHGLKAVARHLGIAKPDREYIPGEQIYEVYRRDPDA